MAVRYSTTGRFRSTGNRGGLLPLRQRETPAREAARAYRIEARSYSVVGRQMDESARYERIAVNAKQEYSRVTWFPEPKRVRGPHLNLNTSGQRRVQRDERVRRARCVLGRDEAC